MIILKKIIKLMTVISMMDLVITESTLAALIMLVSSSMTIGILIGEEDK